MEKVCGDLLTGLVILTMPIITNS